MKKYLSRLSLPAYLIPLAAVLAVIGLIVAIVSCTGEGFGMASMPWVAVLTIAAVLLCGGILYFSATKGDRALPSLGLLLMVLAVSGCIYLMVYGKADVFGTVIFSELERGFAPAERASNLGVVSIAFYLASALLIMVASFFRLSKAQGEPAVIIDK